MNRKLKFWRWFRSLPLMSVFLIGALSAVVSLAPASALRRLVFPVYYQDAIVASSERHGIDPLLVCAIIKCESDWDASAISSAGAEGLMQVMPSTAETLASMGYVDSWTYDPYNLTDAETGIEYGCACLQYLQENLESTDQVIAAYNAGLGTVQDWLDGGLPSISEAITYPETRMYLIKVNESYTIYQRLYDYYLQPV